MNPPTLEPTDFDILKDKGDPLEKLICEDFDSLHLVLHPYAQVWAAYISPRRKGDGSFLEEKWQKFGGHHYTALIRLHHALNAKKEILELCKDEIDEKDYNRLLRVHSLCTTFWDNLGAAIDNFSRLKVEANRALELSNGKRKKVTQCETCGEKPKNETQFARSLSLIENQNLHYHYERRNQYIHSIIVPKRITDRIIAFNILHYQDTSTDWTETKEKFDSVDSKLEQDWEVALVELSNSWHALYSWLQQNDTSTDKALLTDGALNDDDQDSTGTGLSGIGPR